MKKTKEQIDKEALAPLSYPAKEDIYSKEDKSAEAPDGSDDPEWTASAEENKSPGSGLDIPGSELDDADEEIGEEDEENNYYSLGGDNHDDLEEDKGD